MWTNDQLNAIKAPVSDILVTAAAGSGKTAVMVERLIERVLDENGTDIDKILVVTFTKAAASEIKERIANKIAEKLEEENSQRLKKQLVLLSRASICTIHSFCLDILKNNFHLLNLSPNFKVGDTTEVDILKQKALGDVLDKHYDEDDPEFLRVINSFTKKKDDAIEEIIMGIYDFAQSTADPYKYLDDCLKVYSGDCHVQTSYILDSAYEDANYAYYCYKRAMELCSLDASFEKPMSIIGEEMEFARALQKLCKDGWDKAYNFIKDYKFAIMRSGKNMDPSIFEEIKLLRENARTSLKSVIADKINLPLDTIKEDLEYMAPCVLKLCELVKEFSETFAQYKSERDIVDFNDIEHLALKLLTNPQYEDVVKAQREHFDEIYVDEYQDCNGVQEAIFKAVSRENEGTPNMFMVGDMKQCIYRFRNANPQLFKFKSDTYTPYGSQSDYNKIILSKNFRSRGEVLNGINHIFSRIMSESVGELQYTDEEYLYNGATYENVNDDTKYIDLCIIDSSYTDDETEEKPVSVVAEANLVAQKIRNIIDSKYIVYDKGQDKYRPAKYRDIAILLRGISGSGEYFADALSLYGIPAFCDAGAGYFDCEEVGTVVSFIKIIANPLDDINLVSVMRSPVYNFKDSELLKIRTADKNGYFYDAMVKYIGNKDALSSKIKSFLNKIDSYRECASYMATDELLWHILNDTGYMEFIGTLEGAPFKKANIRAFINRASTFYKNNGGDICAFSSYVDEISMSGGEGKAAKLIGENDDVVRIMTIHKSKGLEFPIVFVSQCGKRFNTRDVNKSVIMHHDLGIGIDYVDEKKRFAYSMMTKNAIKDKILDENLSEEMRLLYVALTRAREKLYITGVVSDYSKFMESICHECKGTEDRLHSRTVSSARTYVKWICQAVYEEDELACREIEGGGFIRREIIPIYSLAGDEGEHAESQADIDKIQESSEYKGEIHRRLKYTYPYNDMKNLPRNVTVTEIKRINESEDSLSFRLYRMPQMKKPSFAETSSMLSSANMGTLMHLCMEKIELTDGKNHDTIKSEIESFVSDGIISEENAKYIDIPSILKFFESPVGKAMTGAEKVYREAPFEILVEADEIFPQADTSEKIVVQGMIDAYFVDNNGNLVLMDYKTDRKGSKSVAEFKDEILNRYELQMYYYEKALKLLTGRSVNKKYIYLFDIGEALEI